jgi:3-oxoacyl-[acyl-carrier-protein] synthase II
VSWRAAEGRSGAGPITAFDATDWACRIACEAPRVDGRGGGGPDVEGSFDPSTLMQPKELRKIDDVILYAIAAADEAVRDSGWEPKTDEERDRTGVIIGSGIGGIGTIADTAVELRDKGPRRVSPLLHPLGPDQSHGGAGFDPPRLPGDRIIRW